jgi:hypothetical protein
MNLKNKKLSSFFSELCLNIILFLYIYLPVFRVFPFATTLLLPSALVLSSFVLFNRRFKSILTIKEIKILSLGLLISLIYSFIHDYPPESSAEFFRSYSIIFLRIYIQVILSSISIYLIFRSLGKGSSESLIKSFFWIISVQFLANFTMLLSPTLRDFINIDLLRVSHKLVFDGMEGNLYYLRGYGLASGHLFSYPLFNGFIVCIALWMTFKRNFSYSLIVFASVIPIFLNARIGIISIPIFLISFFFTNFKGIFIQFSKFKLSFRIIFSLLKNILYFLLSIYIISILSGKLLDIIPEDTFKWAQSGVEQVLNLLLYRDVSQSRTLDALTSSHTFYPDNFMSLFLGDGFYIFGKLKDQSFSSDIGYIMIIFFGGLFLSFLLYCSFLYFFFIAFKKANKNLPRFTIICGTLMIFFSNYKGLAFHFENSLLKAMILYCIFVILDHRVQNYDSVFSGIPQYQNGEGVKELV